VDLLISLLHVNQAQLLTLIFANKFTQALAVLDFIEALNELVCEGLDPFNVFLFDLKKRVADLSLPLCDDVDVWRVLDDGLRSVIFDVFKIFELLFVFFVDVMQVFLGDDAFETQVSLLYSGEERGRRIVQLAIYSKGRLGELLLSVHKECVVYHFLTHVTFHVRGSTLVNFLDDHALDNF
jgi:hypothetical protein